MYVSSFHVCDELLDTDYNNCCLSQEKSFLPHSHTLTLSHSHTHKQHFIFYTHLNIPPMCTNYTIPLLL